MKVTLVGAGPGSIGLLTVKGLETLQRADVVLYDRFVSGDILAVIPDSAEMINVGKYAGNHPVPQNVINNLLLEKARQGKNVVRLKGGDPFVFARGGEELEFLSENNIPFEVVPGVTSAVAAAAYAGIPLTHRDCASSFHVITAHAKNNEALNINFDALVKLDGTLIFLMGVSVIDIICERCINAGMDKDMPAAIVENAAVNSQRKFLGTITALPEIVRANNVKSPAVIIIGKVCQFSTRCDWFGQKYLPLRGKRVVVTRVKHGMSELIDNLRELGCYVVEIPCLRIAPLTGSGSALEKSLKNIKGYSWLIFTSCAGVNVFFDYLIDTCIDIRELSGVRIACVGAGTEKELNKRGITVDYVPAEYNGAALAHGLAELVKDGERALILRAKDGDKELTRLLIDAGIDFDDVPVYEKVKDTAVVSIDADAIADNKFDFAAFTSPSAVECFAEVAVCANFSEIKAVCIGEKTAAAAMSYGMDVYVSTDATAESMVEKIKELSA
ncbi:MAG: uroporphyrinogen-III C-methyltransferase [Chitinispirillales bacterium]|jgi:uroporphyrinogen III methyltransferase/synthase|nr:uroporphyrinogen-III C-methyltransferase [Chitinispirillales bacterium]